MPPSDSVITCQPGPQTTAMSSPADIVIMGGANGGGKSIWLMLEAARHIDIPGYRAVIFRRESTDITDPGGLWDSSLGFYTRIGGWARNNSLDWVWNECGSDARISFRGLPHYKDAVSWDGKELAFIGFDEGQLFTELQFWYLFGRMRSTCGVNSCIRMTCNPVHEDDPTGGWLKRLIGWWLDWDTGYPIPERSGVIRWFCRLNNEMFWADSKQELIETYGDQSLPDNHELQPVQPMSLTFVPSKLADNPILMKSTPQYRASLLALPEHLKKAKLDGNWNAKLEAGTFFKIGVMGREGMIVDVLPNDLRYCRAWDIGHTENAGDWTVGAKLGKDKSGTYYIGDIVRGQWEVFGRDERIKTSAEMDDGEDGGVQIIVPEDPSAGKSEASRFLRLLSGHSVKAKPPRKDKAVRANEFASQFNAGNVKMLRAPWNSGLLQRMDAFPTKGIPDDEIDALADAFSHFRKGVITAFVGDSQQSSAEPERNQLQALVNDTVRDEWERIIKEPCSPAWKDSFAAFRDEMGPQGNEQNRVQLRDINGLYEPGNCWWGVEGEDPPPKKRKWSFVSG